MEHPITNAAMTWLAAPVMIVATVACTQDAPMNVETLQAELSSDLPTGTDAASVIAYLNQKGYADGRNYSGQDLIDNATLAHMGANPETFELKSIIRKTKKSMFVSTDMAMTFTFDRSRKLTAIDVREVHTGL